MKLLRHASLLLALTLSLYAQGTMDTARLLKPTADSWPMYNGDYSGRRFSTLSKLTAANVSGLSLAWVARPNAGGGQAGGGGNTAVTIKGTPVVVNGVLYTTIPDHVWALDARDGHELWHYFWKTRGGTHIGSRGVGLWHNSVFFETPDNYLVSLDARTGKERWHVAIASFEEQYFSTWPPIIIDNHVLVGTGNDLDMPGFLQSYDPITGKLQWKFYTVPMKAGDPGLDSWPSLEAARHGGSESRR